MKPKVVSAPGLVEIFRIANDNKLYDGCLLSAFNENAQYWINKSIIPTQCMSFSTTTIFCSNTSDWKSGEKQDLHSGHISTPAFSY